MKFNSLFTHNVKSVLHELCTALYYVPLCKCFYKDSEDDGKKILKLRYSSISIQHRTKGGEKLCCFVFIAEISGSLPGQENTQSVNYTKKHMTQQTKTKI